MGLGMTEHRAPWRSEVRERERIRRRAGRHQKDRDLVLEHVRKARFDPLRPIVSTVNGAKPAFACASAARICGAMPAVLSLANAWISIVARMERSVIRVSGLQLANPDCASLRSLHPGYSSLYGGLGADFAVRRYLESAEGRRPLAVTGIGTQTVGTGNLALGEPLFPWLKFGMVLGQQCCPSLAALPAGRGRKGLPDSGDRERRASASPRPNRAATRLDSDK